MKPQKIIVDGDQAFVYGTVKMLDGTTQKIAHVLVPSKTEWPIIPVSVTTFSGKYPDCIDHPDTVKDWRKRGDLSLTEGKIKT